MTPDLTLIEDFQALAGTGNFSRAAALRHVTQPAFSRRIRALESWAGAPLFERDAQPIALTPAGEAIRPMLGDALRILLAGRDAARAAAGRGRATLRFAATHVLSFTFFPAWLRALETRAPAEGPPAAVALVSDSLSACEALMLRGEAGFLLCHGHAAAPSRLDPAAFRAHRLGADRLLPVAAPGVAGEGRLPFLGYSPDSGLARILAAALPEAAAARLDAVLTAHHAAALHRLARDGRGLAWLPESLVAEDLRAGALLRAGDVPEVALDILLIRPAAPVGAAGEALWSLATGAAPA